MKKLKKIVPKLLTSVVILAYAALAIMCFMASSEVDINYNISDYLNDDSETAISLDIINSEFEGACDVQIMISDISPEDAKSVKKALSELDGVLSVSFDPDSESSYKHGSALLMVMVEGDEYSATAEETLERMKPLLEEYGDSLYIGGTLVSKIEQRDTIESEILIIVIISVALSSVILLLVSTSWLEPILILSTSGIAVLINMGTNVFLGEISYITNSVASVLQLALSVDYGLVLIHKYKKIKDDDRIGGSMLRTIKEIINPVSASALTTVMGLVALLFMSFTIGFDIGIVLIKGIAISFLTSMTLLPSLIIWFDGLIGKTQKGAIGFKGDFLASLTGKSSKIIVPVAAVLIVLSFVVQLFASFTFVDKAGDEANKISSTFGENANIVIVYEKDGDYLDKEIELINRIAEYKTDDGKSVLKSHTAYSGTVYEEYDVSKVVKNLDLSVEDARMLFALYKIYNDEESIKMSPREFVLYADYLIKNDADAAEMDSGEMSELIEKMILVDSLMNKSCTAGELYSLLSQTMGDESALSLFNLNQLYGLYYWDSIPNQKIDFRDTLKLIYNASYSPDMMGMINPDTAYSMRQLYDGTGEFLELMRTPMSQQMLIGYALENYGIVLTLEEVVDIWMGYHESESYADLLTTIEFLPLMTYACENGFITNETAVAETEKYSYLYEAINSSYSYDEFTDAAMKIASGLTNEEIADVADMDDGIQQIYIYHFNSIDAIDADPILGRDFVSFALETSESNSAIAASISALDKATLGDALITDKFMSSEEKLRFIDMSSGLGALASSMSSVTVNSEPDKDAIAGVYIKKLSSTNEIDFSLPAIYLLDFVSETLEESSLLQSKITEEKRAEIEKARTDIATANKMFIGENYCRMIISVDLPLEGEESRGFVDFLGAEVKAIMGDSAHLGGEIISTEDFRIAFSFDNIFISLFTIVAIFIIVMAIFRSVSLPVVLVVIIQGAVWITMSSAVVLGETIFFMSYIIVSCIMMGATIDYGIIVSDSYITARATMNKDEAIKSAISSALPTIFTSGSILTLCGFVISKIAGQFAIKSVGALLGRGTLVAVFMVLFVLPSVLYHFDATILRFTAKKKPSAKTEAKDSAEPEKVKTATANAKPAVATPTASKPTMAKQVSAATISSQAAPTVYAAKVIELTPNSLLTNPNISIKIVVNNTTRGNYERER